MWLFRPAMRIKAVRAQSDNFMYLIYDDSSKKVATVDAVEPQKLQRAIDPGFTVDASLTTHHHWDHAGGNKELAKLYPELKFYGGDDKIDALTDKVSHGDIIKLGSLQIKCLFTPCHTKGHICYFVDNSPDPAVFTGDTLFIGGCGRFFEGNASQMHEALNVHLAGLPDNTKVFCGHEYTVQNLKFALSVDPTNEQVKQKLKWAQELRDKDEDTIPSTIGEEKATNPFMRVSQPALRDVTKTQDDVSCMKTLRDMKDVFRS